MPIAQNRLLRIFIVQLYSPFHSPINKKQNEKLHSYGSISTAFQNQNIPDYQTGVLVQAHMTNQINDKHSFFFFLTSTK